MKRDDVVLVGVRLGFWELVETILWWTAAALVAWVLVAVGLGALWLLVLAAWSAW